MSILEQVSTGRIYRPRKIFVYGRPAVGKTTFASGAPNPIFLCTEDGTGDLDVARLQCPTPDLVLGAMKALYEEDHNYKTVVLDTADWLERAVGEEVARKANVSSVADISYGKGVARVAKQMENFLAKFDKLRDRGLHVVILAHAKVSRFEDPEADPYDRYSPSLNDKHVAPMFVEWAEDVLFATYKVNTREAEEVFGKKRYKAIGSGERVLKTSSRPAYEAKNRLGMPAEIDLSWDAYAKYFPDPPASKSAASSSK